MYYIFFKLCLSILVYGVCSWSTQSVSSLKKTKHVYSSFFVCFILVTGFALDLKYHSNLKHVLFLSADHLWFPKNLEHNSHPLYLSTSSGEWERQSVILSLCVAYIAYVLLSLEFANSFHKFSEGFKDF